MKYDILAGMDENTANTLIWELYVQIYPRFLKTTIDIAALDAHVTIDVAAPPVVTFGDSTLAEQGLREKWHASSDTLKDTLSEQDWELWLARIAVGSFAAKLPKVSLTISYKGGKAPIAVDAALDCGMTLATDAVGGDRYLSVQIVKGVLSLPDPNLAKLLNATLLPFLVGFLNEKILIPVKVPVLHFASSPISFPLPVVQAPYATMYSALGAAPPDVPPPYTWPHDSLYGGFDSKALTLAAGTAFPLEKDVSYEATFLGTGVKGNIAIYVQRPSAIRVNADGTLTAFVDSQIAACLQLLVLGLPPAAFGAAALATLELTFQPVLDGSNILLRSLNVKIPQYKFEWFDVPPELKKILDIIAKLLADALNTFVTPIVSGILSGMAPISILKVSPIPIRIGDKDLRIVFVPGMLATGGPERDLLLVVGKISVQ